MNSSSRVYYGRSAQSIDARRIDMGRKTQRSSGKKYLPQPKNVAASNTNVCSIYFYIIFFCVFIIDADFFLFTRYRNGKELSL